STPFQFFTNHDEPLGALVSEGRKEEFRSFAGFQGDVPDPQDPETYYRSRLDWQEAEREGHAGTLALYRDLLHLRPELPSEARAAAAGPSAIIIRRGSFVLYAALEGGITLKGTARGDVELHTEDRRYGGSGHQPRVADDAITFSEPAAIVVST
ncbi:MAG: malto-oligosyltrehalose trehalohydrolase, partial [Rhodothermales bacterium]